MRGHKTLVSRASDEHGTPESVLESVRAYAPIGIDPCPLRADPEHTRARIIPDEDGLALDWAPLIRSGETAYVNPPYSAMRAWAAKMRAEGSRGAPIVALVAARVDTRWWDTLTADARAVFFFRGRLVFRGNTASAPFPSALVVLGPSPGERVSLNPLFAIAGTQWERRR